MCREGERGRERNTKDKVETILTAAIEPCSKLSAEIMWLRRYSVRPGFPKEEKEVEEEGGGEKKGM